MSTGILILRLIVGSVMAAHGAQKLFGWFGGHGLKATGAFFESIEFRPGLANAALAGLSETVGGLLIAAGLATPLGAAALIGVMVAAAVFVHGRQGLFAQNGGFELPLIYAAAAAAIAFAGPGVYSLDHALGWSLHSTGWSLAAIAVGALSAAAIGAIRWAQTWSARRHTGQPGLGRPATPKPA